jgi:predicted nucleotidyltransferase component of viral defense system
LIGPYTTPQAFRNALTNRLRELARNQGVDLQRLQRRVAFDRLLARLFASNDPPWLLKGGYALDLRLKDRARSTLDLDISVPDPDHLRLLVELDHAVSQARLAFEYLQQAAEHDLGDGFEFRIGRPREEPIGAPGGGVRCSVEAWLAGKTFTRFHLDVGLGDIVLDKPDQVQGNSLLDFAGIPAARIMLYPLAQQFAEKVHAYTFPWQERDNTRVKDLVDLVLLVHLEQIDTQRLRRALQATFETRNTHPLPLQLPEPPPDWAESYTALAQELKLPVLSLKEAHVYLDHYWQRWKLDQAQA